MGQPVGTGAAVSNGVVCPLVRLTALPNLVNTYTCDTLPNSIKWRAKRLCELSTLDSLRIEDSDVAGPLELAGLQSFSRLTIANCDCNAVRLRDLPDLIGLVILNDPTLTALTLERLPKLERCKIDGCSSIVDVSLNDLPRLVAF